MKKLLIIALLLLALLLVSCDGETPSESLPSESAPEVSTHVCDFSGEPEYDENGLPVAASEKALFDKVHELMAKGIVEACYTPTYGGIAEAVMKMSFGNSIGFEYNDANELSDIFGYNYGSFILELNNDEEIGTLLGYTTLEETIKYFDTEIELAALLDIYENKLEPIYSCNIKHDEKEIPAFAYTAESRVAPAIKVAKPKVLIPVFPGTNCEFDTAKALMTAGADPEIFVIRNLTASAIAESVDAFANKVKDAQMIFIPGGFSGGDEPDGSGKFITAFFRNPAIKDVGIDFTGYLIGGTIAFILIKITLLIWAHVHRVNGKKKDKRIKQVE